MEKLAVTQGRVFNREQLREKIRRIRQTIRGHRNAKGDDRCWLDDYKVWGSVSSSPWAPIKLPPFDEMMIKCHEFWTHRQAEKADETPASPETSSQGGPADMIVSPRFWNSDLNGLGVKELLGKLKQVEEAITRHRDIVGRPRTVDDDRLLYAVLPENLPADFRLPSKDEFLGETLAPHAGCPSFHRSHANCPDSVSGCNLSQWGPCNKK